MNRAPAAGESLPPLIAALLLPGAYAHPAPRVVLVQTHISWVLLAGEFAYKIRKPVCLSFVDFRTLEQRRHDCEEELRLNRRYSPDLYLDLVPITGSPERPHMGGAGTAVEYAVKMRRFDETQRLDHVCRCGALRPEHLSDLAQTLAEFHATAQPAPADSRFGTPSAALVPMLDNFKLASEGVSEPETRALLAALQQWTETRGQTLASLMQARKVAGRVRECHGDLHLGNLVLIAQRVRLFDCIEFKDDWRWIDVASEVAFTYMDLLQHRQPGLANWFVDQVLAHSGDYEAAAMIRFYAVYRAMVRTKVANLRLQQTSLAADRQQALDYLNLAQRLATPAMPRLVITHGLSGCGKTWASSQWLLHDASGASLRLRSDVERKRLFGMGALERSGSALDGGIYTRDAHTLTYARLRELAQGLLTAGWSVVVDAAFLRRAERAQFEALAQSCGADFGILAPQVTVKELRERIVQRNAQGRDASEATLAVLEQQRGWIEPLTKEEQGFRLATTPS